MNNPPRVNYDVVSSSYDLRATEGYLSGVDEALNNLARQLKTEQVLDLGCGTGRSLQGFNRLQPPPVRYGLDFSGGMLAQARTLDVGYRLVRGSAPLLPLTDTSFDLVFCAHAFHHFPNKINVVQEAYRVLRPGGAFAIVNFDPREHRHDWVVYTYFEGVYDTDLERFPAMAEQEEMLRQAGFRQVSSPVVQYIGDDQAGETILDSYYLHKGSSSQLILLSDEAYQAGLDRIRAKIAEAKAKGEKIVFRTQLNNRMCHGFKPGLQRAGEASLWNNSLVQSA